MARTPQQREERPVENRFLAFLGWKKMNTRVARQNLPDDECAWAENLQPIGANSWQSVNGAAAALATLTGGDQVARYWPANIGNVDYLIIQTVAGGMVAVNTSNGAESRILANGLLSDSDVTVWNSQRILIADATNGYATWDGSITAQAGGLSPNINVTNGGSLYATAPTVSFSGGNGQGATATAVVVPITVGSVNVTAPGMNYTSAPTVNFSGGGGSGAVATAVIGPIFGVTGNGVLSVAVTNGGSNYTSAPSVSFTGGGGTGATATAVLAGGAVVAVNLTNPGSGYLQNDVVSVNFTGGGGSGAAASVRVWPNIKGNRLDVAFGRVWIGNGRAYQFTGTNGYDDTNIANAAGTTTISDQDLSHFITGIRNLNNYLYIFGDRSIRQIGSITVSSSITLFTPLTLASDIGTTFHQTILSYNRLVLFANKAGVYGIFGASVRKISDDIDGIFQLVDFSLEPSAALNDVHTTIAAGGSIHCYLLLVKYMDPVKGTRTIILMYQNDQWWIVSQGNSLLAIGPIYLASTLEWDSFASSGGDVTQLLQNPNTNVPILFKSALSFNKNPLIAKRIVRSGCAVTTSTAQSFTFTVETEQSSDPHLLNATSVVNWINNAGQQIAWQNNSPGVVTFVGGGYRFPYTAAYGEGKVIGGTVSGSVQGFALNAMAFEYVDTALWGTIP